MATAGRFKLKAIERVLLECGGGFEKKESDHRIRYTVNGRVH